MDKNKRHKRRIKYSIKFLEKYEIEKICKTKFQNKKEKKILNENRNQVKNKINKKLIKI